MKMLHRVLILIISVFCQVWRSEEIFVLPNSKQIIINEGETLNIACISTLIRFKLVNNLKQSSDENILKIFDSKMTVWTIQKVQVLTIWNATYQYNISKENAVISDTGWYCCADYNALYINVTEPNLNRYATEVNWFFVYVKPNKEFINENTTIHLDAPAYITTISCESTSEVKPLLIKGNKFEIDVTNNEIKTLYGLKVNFTLSPINEEYSNKCSIKMDNETRLQAVNHIVFVESTPTIVFYAKENVTFYVQKRSGDNVELGATVYEDGGQLLLQWFKPNGEEIINSQKYYVRFVHYDNNMTLFALLQIIGTNVTDSGRYMLQARNIYSTINKDFSLNVIGKPNCSLTLNESYYSLKQISEFYCEVISNPSSNVTWSFLRYPNYPLFTEKETVYLTNVTQRVARYSLYKIETMVRMVIEVSGQIKCEACNALGCDSKNETILVLDVLPFFINTNMNRTKIRNIDLMTEDLDTVILQCFADGKPKPKVSWYKDNVPLKKNDQYLFKYNYQELHIKYFMRHDSGTYSCQAINRAGTNETYQQITVKYTKYDTLELILVTSIPILSFILVILTIFITIKICRVKKRRKIPDLMQFDGVTSEYINLNLTVKHLEKLFPYDEKWKFPTERLKLKEKLDNGYFGVVMKAEALGKCRNESVTTVAVKMIRQSDKQIYIRAFLSELNIMLQLGKHLNIVNLLGASTKNVWKGELLMIIEYCHFGNLHKYLSNQSYNFINQIDSRTGELDPSIGADILTTVNIDNNSSIYCSIYEDQNFKLICTQDLLSWSFQIARGMEYLSQKKVLHGDLAARNILLAENNVVKICNFGLAKYMDEDYYKKKDCASEPIKWMAIESIGFSVFTTQSDVWSFGIMLWEFFTLGKKPYFDIEAEKLYQILIGGYRMKQPNYAIREIYNIMLQCWETKPTSRPSFTDLVESIGNLLEESVKRYYISLNTQYMDMNETNLNVNPGCSKNEYEICNPHPIQDHSHIEFPSPESNCEDTIELSPMLKHEEDAHLKPIKNTSKEQNLSDESTQ